MINRKEKTYSVVCPRCLVKRKVTYAQNWNIQVGNSTGRCQKCVAPENGKISSFEKGRRAWNKGKIGFGKGHPCYYKAFGPENKNWKGGDREVRGNEHRKWRKRVLERDNRTCQKCHTKTDKLHADHIKSWALFPDLRFELSNGRTLCVPCHKATDNYGARYKGKKHGSL